MTDERAVSTTVGYALTLGITTLLITGLLITAGGFVEDERERAIRSELGVIGQQIAADAQAGDRFVSAGETSFGIRRDIPNEVAGTTYSVAIVVDDPRETYVRLRSTDPEVTVEVDMALETAIEERSFGGGEFEVTYDAANDRLVVGDA